MKIQTIKPGSNYYHRLLKLSQLQSSFDNLQDFIQYLNFAQNSTFLQERGQLVLFSNGTFGKDRKYFQLLRLQFQLCPSLQHIIQVCKTDQKLSQQQVRNFLLYIAKQIKNAREKDSMLDQQGLDYQNLQLKFQNGLNRGLRSYQQTILKLRESIQQVRKEVHAVSQICEQKFLQLQLQFSERFNKICIAQEQKMEEEMLDQSCNKMESNRIQLEQPSQNSQFQAKPKEIHSSINRLYYQDATENLKYVDKQTTHLRIKTSIGIDIESKNMIEPQPQMGFKQECKIITHPEQSQINEVVLKQSLRVIVDQLKLVRKSQIRCKFFITKSSKNTISDAIFSQFMYVEYKIVRQFGELISQFSLLEEFDLSINHNLFEYACWDSLVNSLNSLDNLKKITVRVQRGNSVNRSKLFLAKVVGREEQTKASKLILLVKYE